VNVRASLLDAIAMQHDVVSDMLMAIQCLTDLYDERRATASHSEKRHLLKAIDACTFKACDRMLMVDDLLEEAQRGAA
jgi:hypothetical protein